MYAGPLVYTGDHEVHFVCHPTFLHRSSSGVGEWVDDRSSLLSPTRGPHRLLVAGREWGGLGPDGTVEIAHPLVSLGLVDQCKPKVSL